MWTATYDRLPADWPRTAERRDAINDARLARFAIRLGGLLGRRFRKISCRSATSCAAGSISLLGRSIRDREIWRRTLAAISAPESAQVHPDQRSRS
jgi:hypothetical protein